MSDAAVGTRWIDQWVFYDEELGIRGNCAQCAIASLLGLQVSEVPHFAEGVADGGEFWDRIEDFFEKRGLCLLMMPNNFRHDGLWLASGMSVRGVAHLVVMKGDKVYHDPHPAKTGLLGIDHVYIVVPYDPGK